MLRAIGLRRSGLVGSFSLEGWLYAAGASAVGALAGVGVGRVVVVVASRIFDGGANKAYTLTLHFAATGRSVERGFSVGFVLALATVVISSLFVARLNVIRAIRDLPEPPRRDRHLGRLLAGGAVGAIGLALTGQGVASGTAILALLGPALVGVGLIAVLRTFPLRLRVSVVAIVVLAWEVFAFQVIHQAFAHAGIATFVVQGIVLIAYAVALVTENQELIGGVLRAAGGGARNMSLRLGLAYPLARRLRTGLTLAMYSIVIFFLAFLSVFSHLFASQVGSQTRKEAGTATIEVESNAADPVPAANVASLPGVTFVTPASEVAADAWLGPSATGANTHQVEVVGFDDRFVGHGSPALHSRPAGAPDDSDAYRAVAADPGRVLVGQGFNSHGVGPPGGAPAIGQQLTVRDPMTGRTAVLTVAGTVEQSGFNGNDHVFVSEAFAERFWGPRAAPTLLYVGTARHASADQLAAKINGTFIAEGADASTFHRLVGASLGQSLQFFTLLKGYVALGLLVGIAGLGVVMVRAVRERRREVGVLRSLGFSGVAIRRAFMAESSFVALEGIGVGLGLALVTAWRTVDSHAFGQGLTFSVPWLELLVLVAATFAASLLATAAPALQAARIRPAVALRVSD
jgi:putative ABC transport system permease protein